MNSKLDIFQEKNKQFFFINRIILHIVAESEQCRKVGETCSSLHLFSAVLKMSLFLFFFLHFLKNYEIFFSEKYPPKMEV